MTLEIITDDSLAPLKHGFFGRLGGSSSGVYAGLNCGPGSADQADNVAANRGLAADALGVDAQNLVSPFQVHSTKVLHVTGPVQASSVQADAMVTGSPGVALGVLSADCQPVLFADHRAGVIGAAHAGWKGALNGVLGATLDAMEEIGAVRSRIVAVIGPCISQQAYEVGAEFRDRFMQADPGNARFFLEGQPGKFQFDLPGFGVDRLLAAGVGRARWTGHCTYANPTRFFSYRYGQHNGHADYGRLLSAIRV